MRDFQLQPERASFGRCPIETSAITFPAGTLASCSLPAAVRFALTACLEQVKAALAGRTCTSSGGVKPNPSVTCSRQPLEIVKHEVHHFLWAVGVGLVISARIIAAAALIRSIP